MARRLPKATTKTMKDLTGETTVADPAAATEPTAEKPAPPGAPQSRQQSRRGQDRSGDGGRARSNHCLGAPGRKAETPEPVAEQSQSGPGC
ncbi:MAG: hypothetical protein ACPGYL_06555 [Rhodospirillaceae bacterium]